MHIIVGVVLIIIAIVITIFVAHIFYKDFNAIDNLGVNEDEL